MIPVYNSLYILNYILIGILLMKWTIWTVWDWKKKTTKISTNIEEKKHNFWHSLTIESSRKTKTKP